MRLLTLCVLLLTFLFSTEKVCAQPFPFVDISLQHDEGAGVLRISLRANDYEFAELVSNLVFTVRWQESSTATLGLGSSAWCPAPNQALPLAPSAMAVPGNSFRYRTYNSIGFVMLSELADDGGCEQSLLADTWIEVYTIPVNNDPGGSVFEIAVDQFAADDNREFYISLNGQDRTGSVFTIPTSTVEDGAVEPTLGVFPNPTTGPVRLNLPGLSEGRTSVDVLDATGRLLLQRAVSFSSPGLDLSGLQCGAYFIRMIVAEEAVVLPIVIERP